MLVRALGWGAGLSHRRRARFAASERHDWWAVLGALVRLLGRPPATAVGAASVLVVDSTVVEPADGPHLPGRQPVCWSIRKRLVAGYELVSACVVGAQQRWPRGVVPHRKPACASERAASGRRRRQARPGELPSKLDLALRLVELAVGAGIPSGTVVRDSAFAVQWWLRAGAGLGRPWLVATRQDRRLRSGAASRAGRAWTAGLPLRPVAAGQRGASVWGGLLPSATLLDRHCSRRGLACQAASFERRSRRGVVTERWYLVTSQLDGDLTAVWQHGQPRWPIERLHREAKQHLHLAAFHVRTWAAIVALVALSSLRVSLLAFLRAADPVCGGLSVEALGAALRTAACSVATERDGRVRVSLPPTLPATTRWQVEAAPLPPPWWPLSLKAA